MTWLWQPLLPGGAQLLSGAAGVNEDRTGSADGTSTTAAVVTLLASVTGSAAGTSTTSATGDNGITPVVIPGPLPTSGGQRRKTLPYGWWNTAEEAKEELAQASQAIAEARKEVKALGEVRPGTLEDLRRTLAFVEVEKNLNALEATASKARANKELAAMAAEVERQRLEYERIQREIEDEEDIEFLLANLI